MTEESSIAVGDLFAHRYRIGRLLGRGGMGAVFASFDEELQEHIALKVLTIRDPLALGRFQREVRLARRVTHPSVARTHDFGSFGGVHFLTMELLDGESLQQRLKKAGAFSVEETVRIGSALCAGLVSAHEAGVLHRDLKPANVMLSDDGRVVITDFGIALPIERATDDVVTLGFIGTPRYMAPEVFEGAPFDARADLYALGLMLWEMLTGTRYRLSRLGDDDPTSVATQPSSLDKVAPPALALFIRSLLSLAPEGRPASAVEAGQRLASATGNSVVVGATKEAADVAPVPTPPLPGGKRLGVAPFTGRGGEEANELAAVLSEELVDVLSRNTGVQVLAYRPALAVVDADATAAGRGLGADWMVTGTVMRSGSRVRISVRLIEVDNGAQPYSERFDTEVADVFDLQDRIALQIGEALRVEIALVARRGSAGTEAIECYLRGRRKLRAHETTPGAGVLEFEAALARAPDFGVAIAAHAIASVRRWWRSVLPAESEELRRSVEQSVRRAENLAPDIAETHLAAAMWAAHTGDYRTAVEALRCALDIAPTCAAAHDYLGQLECEAGRGESGAKRIELAYALDASIVSGQVWMIRWHALSGRVDGAIARLDELDARFGCASINRLQLRMRIAAWRGDREALKWCRDHLAIVHVPGVDRLVAYIDVALGEVDAMAYLPETMSIASTTPNQRFASYMLQLAAEAICIAGHVEQAQLCVTRGVDAALADLDWLEHCPALEALRNTPEYDDIRTKVRVRAAEIWST